MYTVQTICQIKFVHTCQDTPRWAVAQVTLVLSFCYKNMAWVVWFLDHYFSVKVNCLDLADLLPCLILSSR